jgi:hypothetical protein
MPLSDQQTLTTTASVTSAPTGKPRSATPVTVDAKATTELLINLDTKRVGASVFNGSNTVLWIDYSADVGPEQHLVPIGPGQLWESSSGTIDAIYGKWGTPPSGETLTGAAHVRSFVIR